MNLLEAYRAETGTKEGGFTLLELLMVCSLSIIIGALTLPFGITFFRLQLLHEAHAGVVESLREAHMYALSGRHNTAHGVRFFEESYVRFQGDSYDSRDQSQDHLVALSPLIMLSAPEEVVFELFSGTPNATSTILLTMHEVQRSVEVAQSGLVTQ